jgi:autotransporter-associated beta strand protein
MDSVQGGDIKMRSIGSSTGTLARGMRVLLAGTAISVAATLPVMAGNGNWLAAPATGDFNTAANWAPAAVPTNVAVFNASSITALSFSADTTVGALSFSGSANYTLTNAHNLTFNGVGISIGGTGNETIITASGGTTKFNSGGGGGAQMHFVTQAGGTLDISALAGGFVTGSIAGAGNYSLGSALLAVGSDNTSTVVSGVIAGGSSSAFEKDGAGTLTLSGTNIYTGHTLVNAGGLVVDGSIASSGTTLVQSGATLSGTGTVGDLRVFGTFAPGSGVAGSTMNLAHSLTMDSTGTYMVQVNPTSASSAHVTAFATLAGTANAQFAAGSYIARNYTILTSGSGLSGTTFDALTTNGLPAGFTARLSYTSTDVLLNLDAVLGIATGPALSRNQQNAATSINSFFNNGGTLPPAFVSVFGLTGAPLSNALTQLSGETAVGSQQTTFGAMTQFIGAMTDPSVAGRDPGTAGASAASFADEGAGRNSARDAYAMFNKAPLAQAYEPRWSVWAAGFGGSQTTDGSTAAGSNNSTSQIYGTAVGADYRLSPSTIAGFSLAGGGTNFSVANGGSGRSDLFQAGAFVRHNVGPAYIAAALAYGWQDITTDRTVTASGIDRLRAEFNANTLSGRIESGYRFVSPLIGGIGITPYVAGQVTNFDRPAYAESVVSGSSAFALAYGSSSVTDSRSELGVRTDKSYAMPNGIFTLRGRAAWAHDFNPNQSVAATFQALPGASFVVNGAAQAPNSALTTASAEMKWLNGWSAAATFEGEFSDVTRSYAGKGVVRYSW